MEPQKQTNGISQMIYDLLNKALDDPKQEIKIAPDRTISIKTIEKPNQSNEKQNSENKKPSISKPNKKRIRIIILILFTISIPIGLVFQIQAIHIIGIIGSIASIISLIL